jgi:hypothetical protein
MWDVLVELEDVGKNWQIFSEFTAPVARSGKKK